jgi:hypothetical protein
VSKLRHYNLHKTEVKLVLLFMLSIRTDAGGFNRSGIVDEPVAEPGVEFLKTDTATG